MDSTSGYEYDNGPDIEVYLEPDPQNSMFEVWIPVVKKVPPILIREAASIPPGL